jgi:hypothetical protein
MTCAENDKGGERRWSTALSTQWRRWLLIEKGETAAARAPCVGAQWTRAAAGNLCGEIEVSGAIASCGRQREERRRSGGGTFRQRLPERAVGAQRSNRAVGTGILCPRKRRQGEATPLS